MGSAVLVALIVGLLCPQSGSEHPSGSRLRYVSADIQRLAEDASERSPVFRQLVSALGRTDIIVYVEFGQCSGRVRGCLLFVGASPGWRYVRVRLDPFRSTPFELAPLLAHEIEHAIEVGNAAGVIDHDSFRAFVPPGGFHGSHGAESEQAVTVEHRVAQELASGR